MTTAPAPDIIALPRCRYRRQLAADGSFVCASACVVVLSHANAGETCPRCPSPDRDCSVLLLQVRELRQQAAGDCQSPAPPPAFGPGTELLKLYSERGIPSCQQCHDLAASMNAWGVDGCRERLEELVADILPRAREWASHGWLTWLTPDVALKAVITSDVETAIANAAGNSGDAPH